MRAEQAADFLNSYVRGRLLAAKERMLLQGMWMGGNINLGFIVDDRKTLPSGAPNPYWRKYIPFPPCSEVVVRIHEIFIAAFEKTDLLAGVFYAQESLTNSSCCPQPAVSKWAGIFDQHLSIFLSMGRTFPISMTPIS
jgi:hypothetical protein